MVSVVQISARGDRDTVALLRVLLADALSGDVAGVAVCFKTRRGEERSGFSGVYKRYPAEAVNAAMRLSWRLTREQDSCFNT
jgi:hypothetical protein